MKEDSIYKSADSITTVIDCSKRTMQRWIKQGKIDSKYLKKEVSPGRKGYKFLINPQGLPEPYRMQFLQHLDTKLIQQDDHSDLPQWAYEKAKARLDVVHLLERELENAKNDNRNITPVYDETADMYNSGHILEDAFRVLGKVSGYSIQQRWWPIYKEARKNGEDVIKALAPDYNTPSGHRSVPQWYRKRIKNILLHPNQINPTRGIKIINTQLRQEGKKKPCSLRSAQRWVNDFKDQHYDRWILMRDGQKALRDKVLPYLDRDWNLLNVGQVLIADGHVVNFDVKHPRTGKAHRPILICFYDGRSRFPVGYSLMPTENTDNISEALADGVKTLGKFPDAVILDNGRAFKGKYFTKSPHFYDSGLAGVYERHGILTHFTKPYSGQSKPIEPFWNQLNERFSKMLPTYRGSSIANKVPRLKRNEKDHKKAYDAQVGDWLPTIPEVLKAIKHWSMETYGMEAHGGLKKGETPRSVLEAGQGPGVEWGEMMDLMLHAKEVKPRRARFTLEGIVYQNWDVLTGWNKPVLVRYTRRVPDRVWMFDNTGTRPEFMGIAQAFDAVHPLEKLTNGDGDFDPTYRERLKQRKKLEKRAKRNAEELNKINGDMAEPVGRLMPGDEHEAYEIGSLPDATPNDRREGTEIEPLGFSMDEEENEGELLFDYAYERFEHIAGKEAADITDKDIAFLKDFAESESYSDLYADKHAAWVDNLINDNQNEDDK